MANTFKFEQKHINTWNTVTPKIMALENRLEEIKKGKEWKGAYDYFSLLTTKGIISERPTKANGYSIGSMDISKGHELVAIKHHLDNFLKLKPEVLEIESKLETLKDKDWTRARDYFGILASRGVIDNAPTKRNGYKLELTVSDAYIDIDTHHKAKKSKSTKHSGEFRNGKKCYCTTDDKDFVSCVHAGSVYGVHPSYIAKICDGLYDDYQGKHFCWAEDKPKHQHPPKQSNNPNWRDKAVYCITDDKEFPNGKIAGLYYGIPANGISECCNGKLKTTHKMRFCFVADKEKYADEIAATKASRKVRVTAKFITRKRKGV